MIKIKIDNSQHAENATASLVYFLNFLTLEHLLKNSHRMYSSTLYHGVSVKHKTNYRLNG